MSESIASNFIRTCLREESLVSKFIPIYPIMENCPEKDEYDKQRKIVLEKEREVCTLYRQPFEAAFEDKYKNRIQDYINHLIKRIHRETDESLEELIYDYSYWSIMSHLPNRIVVACMKVDVEIPFEYLFRTMSAEEWFNSK